MSLYFFDFTDGSTTRADPDGVELPSRAEARKQAIGTLVAVAQEGLPDGQTHLFSVTVREDAEPIFQAQLSFTSKWLNHGAEKA